MDTFKRIKSVLKNKYAVVIILFLGWMTFFDANSLISRFNYECKIKKLNKEIALYEKETEQTLLKKRELQASPENLEKFAREEYLMKNGDEDIFIIYN